MGKHKTVGTCGYCEDPIYDFQKTKDGMHDGCARIRKAEIRRAKVKGGA